jgi:hypothetical protein
MAFRNRSRNSIGNGRFDAGGIRVSHLCIILVVVNSLCGSSGSLGELCRGFCVGFLEGADLLIDLTVAPDHVCGMVSSEIGCRKFLYVPKKKS